MTTAPPKDYRVLGGPFDGTTVRSHKPVLNLYLTVEESGRTHTYTLQHRRDGTAYVHKSASHSHRP